MILNEGQRSLLRLILSDKTSFSPEESHDGIPERSQTVERFQSEVAMLRAFEKLGFITIKGTHDVKGILPSHIEWVDSVQLENLTPEQIAKINEALDS